MNRQQEEYYQKRIAELEAEVKEREKDLAVYRKELSEFNRRVEALILELRRDVQLAGLIQKHLVPTELPNISGFEFSSKFVPSTKSGGDYFDIFEHHDRFRFGLIVAGSSGHTVSAFLLSVLLKITNQMEARKGGQPHRMMDLIAKDLVPYMGDQDEVNVFYGLFDRRSYEMQYCRVGEVIALHQDYQTGKLTSLVKEAEGLRASRKQPFKSQSLPLNPRDRLIVCTSGVVEAQNLKGQGFGFDRLFRTVLEAPKQGVHEVRNEILFRVNQFLEGQQPQKDMSVVVMEVKDRVIKLARPRS